VSNDSLIRVKARQSRVKVALVQLPVQSHDYTYSVENVPLAAGYLASYAASHNVSAEIQICPHTIQNLGGDAAILKWLGDVRPGIVGFSCYVWNIERTLNLCRMVGQRMERCLIVVGGPEITPDNYFLLSHGDFHIGVVGEGEDTFLEILRTAGRRLEGMRNIPGLMIREGFRWICTSPRALIQDLSCIPSPYLTGILEPSLNRSMVMETVRGCPMRCTYCYYHKRSPGVLLFPEDRIGAELAWAKRSMIGEVTIIDPCFGRRPGLLQLLKAMGAPGLPRLPFSCELNAEDLDEELVDALAKAGLMHVEIGLQTTSAKTLKNIGRFFDREAFTKGIRLLKKAGVRVMTDIMVGLPGDSLDDVIRSIDFVLEEGLYDDVSLYPLSVLPGTVLRAKAHQFGINYQYEPPYLVTQTADMACDDIRAAFAYAEEATGIDYFPVEPPRTGGPGKPERARFVSRIIVGAGFENERIGAEEIGQALCIEVSDTVIPGYPEVLDDVIHKLLAVNPYTLVSWVLPEDALNSKKAIEFIISSCRELNHPADRDYMARFTPKRSCQLFISSRTASGGTILTQIPLSKDPSRPLWAALPAYEGSDQEKLHSEHLSTLLGYMPDIRYHDLVIQKPDTIDNLLATRILSFEDRERT
jgi:radical SAM superfamily enzyme YgiQ (UPF0313 family)